MLSYSTSAIQSRIVLTDDGFVAVYAGVDYDTPARSNELCAALDLVEIVGLYEGSLMALTVTETLRPKLAGLGYELQEGV